MQVNVLGTQYTIKESNKVDDPALEQCDGYCDDTIKVCVIDTFNCTDTMAKQDMQKYKKKVIRHELVHAFLSESGLSNNSWAENEEIVDWIAAMFPKMKEAFEQAEQLADLQLDIPKEYVVSNPKTFVEDLLKFGIVNLKKKGGE